MERDKTPPSVDRSTQQSNQRNFDSHELFGNEKEIVISHEDVRYMLRITSNNKLILTK